uniref:Small ribosomal subunit protein uS4c n=1 Tax=Monomastix sp. (strain OKE-1) TaxID=141716 RepID=C0JWM5_MONSK|nr:ribosomal protein S4 [Monomastix sp. OKE-1]ACK36886.1 ribosomal protein S4 [Monomastix sp. OKE-1]
MSRYRGPRLRITRRLGDLPGLVNTAKSSGKTTLPGQHGGSRPQKASQYSIRLKEKQKLRFNYGVNESQLVRYVKKARNMKGSTGELVLQLLEMRLDSIVFRSGLAPTLRAARQLVSHGHIAIETKTSQNKTENSFLPVNIPSYQCRPGDNVRLINLPTGEARSSTSLPAHIHFDNASKSYQVKQLIPRSEVSCSVNELLIIEYYSRKV